jgi:hypothetical protein
MKTRVVVIVFLKKFSLKIEGLMNLRDVHRIKQIMPNMIGRIPKISIPITYLLVFIFDSTIKILKNRISNYSS